MGLRGGLMGGRMGSTRAGGLLVAAGVTAASLAFAEGTETPWVDRREANQERRIDQGAATGQLTRYEEYRLRERLDRIQGMEDRFKSDGVVTPGERARLNGMLDANSAAIYRQRHDGQFRRR